MVDDESAQLFRIREYGYESLGEVRSGPGGKRFGGSEKWSMMSDEVLELVSINYKVGIPLIIAGPGFFKETISAKARDGGIVDKNDIYLASASSGGISGLKEALSKGDAISKTVQGMRFARENELVDTLMERIGKGSKASYGQDQVKLSLDSGAVDTLLISETLFRTQEGKDLISLARTMGANHCLISTSHDGGKMLDKLGGMGALLRFDV
jgi:protein pelota